MSHETETNCGTAIFSRKKSNMCPNLQLTLQLGIAARILKKRHKNDAVKEQIAGKCIPPTEQIKGK